MSAGYLKKCSNGRTPKQRHETRAAAERQRESLIAARIWTRSGSNTYVCSACGGYHAGKVGRVNRGGGTKKSKTKPTLASQ